MQQSLLTVKKTIEINAPREAVWEALTNPEKVKQYFYGTELDTDWQPGHPIYYRGSWEGRSYEDKGTVLEVAPLRRLRHDYWSSFSPLPDAPENYQTITYDLDGDDQRTTLTVTQENLPAPENVEHSEQSWEAVLQELKKLVEGK